jgi:DNA-binding response OmpR family regulator
MQNKPKVLVLDDDLSIQRSLKAYLEDEGFEVLTAESSEQGLECLALEPFDVAIVDIRLPGMDGNSFIERAQNLFPEMVVIVCTGSVGYRPPERLRAQGLGEDDVFQKPLMDMSVIANAIRRRLGMRRGE